MAFGNFIAGGILLIIGLINLAGKATFMIAGYNTMSPGRKARRDIKKISYFIGWMLIICAMILVVGGALSEWVILSEAPIMISFALFIIIILSGVVYMNVSKRFKINVVQIDTDKISKQKGYKLGLIIGLAVLLFVGAFMAYIFAASAKPPVYTISDTSLVISGMHGRTVAISDIQSLELVNDLPGNLFRTNGSELGSMLKGHFRSNGTDMEIFADTSKPPFIYLYTTNGLIILNDKSADKTEALYLELKEKALK